MTVTGDAYIRGRARKVRHHLKRMGTENNLESGASLRKKDLFHMKILPGGL